MAQRRRPQGDPEEVPTGTGLLRRARDAIAGRQRQIDSEIDEATGRRRRKNNNPLRRNGS